MSSEFPGFTLQTVDFFRQLAENNTKSWFDAHKNDYERHVKTPSQEFVAALGERLRPLVPGLIADPRANQSLFRINRDIRFSTDKSPYKTHLGLWLWVGSGKRMDCSGFYFHLEPNQVILSAGVYMFPKPLLEVFRAAAVDSKRGKSLAALVRQAQAEGLAMGGEHYKRPPQGTDANHPNARLLLHNGLYASWSGPIPEAILSPGAADFCLGYYRQMVPIHRWLSDLIHGR